MKPEPASLRVRAAGPDDLELLVAWAAAMAWETERKRLDADTLRRGIAVGLADPGRARYLVAEVTPAAGAEPAGTLMLTREWSDWRAGEWWWIQSVYVPEGHRRRGVLRALVDHVRALAAAAPEVCGLRLYVARENRAAQAAYARLGLRDAGYLVLESEQQVRA